MPISVADKRAAFRRLHQSGCFVIPNPWDVGSALMLRQLGFKALASTSAGLAWSMGRADNRVTCDDVIAHLTQLCAAVDLPVNADFEGGFAEDPDHVAANVTRAVAAGVAGLSIEDSTGDKATPLYEARLRSSALVRRARRSMPAEAMFCRLGVVKAFCGIERF
jgi:2-methylisocitrate lyase-like PEP mutase family enzyme